MADTRTRATKLLENDAHTWSYATGTTSTSGDNTIVAAPGAGYRLVVSELACQLETTTATTYIWKDGVTARRRVRAGADGDGVYLVFALGSQWKLAENAALVLNLSGANASGYTVRYRTERIV